jgi:hypothetical protein
LHAGILTLFHQSKTVFEDSQEFLDCLFWPGRLKGVSGQHSYETANRTAEAKLASERLEELFGIVDAAVGDVFFGIYQGAFFAMTRSL